MTGGADDLVELDSPEPRDPQGWWHGPEPPTRPALRRG